LPLTGWGNGVTGLGMVGLFMVIAGLVLTAATGRRLRRLRSS